MADDNCSVDELKAQVRVLRARLVALESEKRGMQFKLRSELADQYESLMKEMQDRHNEEMEKAREIADEYEDVVRENLSQARRKDQEMYQEKIDKLEKKVEKLELKNFTLEEELISRTEQFKAEHEAMEQKFEEVAIKQCIDSLLDRVFESEVASREQLDVVCQTEEVLVEHKSTSCVWHTSDASSQCSVERHNKSIQNCVENVDESVQHVPQLAENWTEPHQQVVECCSQTEPVGEDIATQVELFLNDESVQAVVESIDGACGSQEVASEQEPIHVLLNDGSVQAVVCSSDQACGSEEAFACEQEPVHVVNSHKEVQVTPTINQQSQLEKASETTLAGNTRFHVSEEEHQTLLGKIEELTKACEEKNREIEQLKSNSNDVPGGAKCDLNMTDSFVGSAFDFPVLESTRKTVKTEIPRIDPIVGSADESLTERYLKHVKECPKENPLPTVCIPSTKKKPPQKSKQKQPDSKSTAADEIWDSAFQTDSNVKKGRKRVPKTNENPTEDITRSKRKKIVKSPQPDRRSLESPIPEETTEKPCRRYNTRSRRRLY